jgi:hypothetical protein
MLEPWPFGTERAVHDGLARAGLVPAQRRCGRASEGCFAMSSLPVKFLSMEVSPLDGSFAACIAGALLASACLSSAASNGVTDPLRDAGTSVADTADAPAAYRGTRTVAIGGVSVDVIVDKPARDAVDALVVYHGTVGRDALVKDATQRTLDEFRALLDRDDVMIVSVAYPEEGLLFGDNLREAEAALLWVKRSAAADLGVRIGRVFLGGHSQGGYLVTRLNTLHEVDGVVANAPGPLDLVYRCGLEERGEEAASAACGRLRAAFGPTTSNAEAYASRSLLRFTGGHRSKLLVVQGLADSPIQMRSWPLFRAALEACMDCRARTFLELPGLEHPALFRSAEARAAFGAFLREP